MGDQVVSTVATKLKDQEVHISLLSHVNLYFVSCRCLPQNVYWRNEQASEKLCLRE